VKKNEVPSPKRAQRLWENENGDKLLDAEIEFRRSLSPQERMTVLQHFLTGIQRYSGQHEYAIKSVDFENPRLLKMTWHVLAEPWSRALLATVVDLRKIIPVASWNGNPYSLDDDNQIGDKVE
jgi:hypothetical protein